MIWLYNETVKIDQTYCVEWVTKTERHNLMINDKDNSYKKAPWQASWIIIDYVRSEPSCFHIGFWTYIRRLVC